MPNPGDRSNSWHGPAAAVAVLVIAAVALTSLDSTPRRNTPVAEIAPQPVVQPLFGDEPTDVVAGFVNALNRADTETALGVLAPTIDGFGLPGVPEVAQFDRPTLRAALHHFYTRDTRLLLNGCKAAAPAGGATIVHCDFAVDNSFSRALGGGSMSIDMAFEVTGGTITNVFVIPIVGIALPTGVSAD